MNDRGVAAMEVAAAQRLRGRLGIVVVTLHHDVAADDDLADRDAVARDIVALLVDDAQVARGDQLHALTRLDDGSFRRAQRIVLGPRLAHSDEWRGLRQTVYMRDASSELAFDALDGDRKSTRL